MSFSLGHHCPVYSKISTSGPVTSISFTYMNISLLTRCRNGSIHYGILQRRLLFLMHDGLMIPPDGLFLHFTRPQNLSRQFTRPLTKISNWNESEVLVDRKSQFQGRHVDLQSSEDIPNILSQFLKEHKSIAKNSSHPSIIAWRTADLGTDGNYKNIKQGYKDNGEKSAGSKILDQVLVKYNLVNVLVIVTRWYGGQPIGSLRFRHIVNCSFNSLRKGKKIR